MKRSCYDQHPFVAVPDGARACVSGWDAIAHCLREKLAALSRGRVVLVVECYPGVREEEIARALASRLQPGLIVPSAGALRPKAEVDAVVAPCLAGDDPVFGFLAPLALEKYFDPILLGHARSRVDGAGAGLVLVAGVGARLIADGDILVYADLARWEAQRRFRRGETGNLGADNPTAPAAEKYKRAFFADWRAADRFKAPLLGSADFFLDTHDAVTPKLAAGAGIRRGLEHAASRPFRVVPFFDPAPWGGQWMKETFGLDPSPPNYGWCFDCVPEENSLVLGFGSHRFELPALDLVLFRPRELLGQRVFARFGAEFPIRFDLLDTIGGGNLSLQVHPLEAYARRCFGLTYTQDESYYLLDAVPGAQVMLGCRDGIDPTEFARGLEAARRHGTHFDAERYAAGWPAHKHDHFLIPAGTLHCSGAGCLVLEVSATPYIFTFKLWDWGRPGLDGKPRPVHLEHGLANLQADRNASWVRRELINAVTPGPGGPGWRAERTGLHSSQFIDSHRHWFSVPVEHHTGDSVNVLNLIAGESAVVESPRDSFAPFTVHYAETFIVPAAVGSYRIRPAEAGSTCATLRTAIRS